MEIVPDPLLTFRFSEALQFAVRCHWDQARKGTKIPYLSHLLQVCGIVLEAGGDEDQAIAALLHDAIEDAPPGQAEWVRSQIRGRFGERVLGIVEACTDADTQPKPPWRERKEAYLSHLASVDSDALLVSSADKLHNARAILHDLEDIGDDLWDRFNAQRDDQLWYYRGLVTAYERAGGSAVLAELDQVVSAIEEWSPQ